MQNIIENICSDLKISKATFSNWQKLGLVPNHSNIVTAEDYNSYKNELQKNISHKLSFRVNRSRSNEKLICFQGINSSERKNLLQSLVKTFEESTATIEEGVFALIICVLKSNNFLNENSLLNPITRIEKTCSDWLKSILQKTSKTTIEILSLFEKYFIPNANDDLIGAFYQSVQNIGQKSSTGSFYTPKELLPKINIEKKQTIYDPCCGSGNILINSINKHFDSENIFASDIDDIALKICEVNLSLFFNNPNIKSIIFKKSFFEPIINTETTYDIIITNPPWGYKFNAKEKQLIQTQYYLLGNAESFSICLYNAVQLLNKKGKLFFFLPKSFLNVKWHSNIRRFIFSLDYALKIKLLGNAFKGVVSKTLLLCIDKSEKSFDVQVFENEKTFNVEKYLLTQNDNCIFLKVNSLDKTIVKKIYSLEHYTLKGNCEFALGIVTGDNKNFIQNKKTKNNEKIYRGKSIIPYCLLDSDEYIEFTPEKFQQVANEKYYRTKKVVYRFIADRIICCISENNELMLNSANIFIPKINYPFELIVALFNSSIYAFLYKKKFDAIKVLRSHIEQLPIPKFNNEQQAKILKIYNKIVESQNSKILKIEMDTLIARLFFLSEDEIEYIRGEI